MKSGQFKPYITENELIKIYQFQYNYLFPLIISKSQFFFMNSLKKQVQYHLQILNKNSTRQSIIKIQEKFSRKYLIDKEKVKNCTEVLKTKNENEMEYLDKLNCIIHCPNCSGVYHKCGQRLVLINCFVFCLNCKEVYNENQINLYCDNCQEQYITKLREINDYDYMSYFPISIKKYHCKIDNEEKILCPICQNDLYVDILNPININKNSQIKEVTCIKCDTFFQANKFSYKCKICGIFFKSQPKIYNEFNNYKTNILIIIQTLMNGEAAFPKFIINCNCHCNLSNVKQYKHLDGGTLYEGLNFHNKKIIICDKCFNIYDFENFRWVCPFCFENINDKNNHTILRSSNIKKCNCGQDINTNYTTNKNLIKYHEKITNRSMLRNQTEPELILSKSINKSMVYKSILNDSLINKTDTKNNLNFQNVLNNSEREIIKYNHKLSMINSSNNLAQQNAKLGKQIIKSKINNNAKINVKIQTFYNNYAPLSHIISNKLNNNNSQFIKSKGIEKNNFSINENINNSDLLRNYSYNHSKQKKRSITESAENQENYIESKKNTEYNNIYYETNKKLFNHTLTNIKVDFNKSNNNIHDKLSKSTLLQLNNNIFDYGKNNNKVKNKINMKKFEIIKEINESDKKTKQNKKKRIIKKIIPMNKSGYSLDKQKAINLNENNIKTKGLKNNFNTARLEIIIKNKKNDHNKKSNKIKKVIKNHNQKNPKILIEKKQLSQEVSLRDQKLNIKLNEKIPKINNKAISPEPKKNKIKEEFNSDDYNILGIIGEGTFGQIYSVENIKTNKIYALKKITINNKEDLDINKNEYEFLMKLTQENKKLNLVKIYGIEIKQLDKFNLVLYVLMELAISDWEKEIKIRSSKNKYYIEEELIQILKNLVSTFAILQKKGICHRDVKPQNILCFRNNIYKITDFGEAKSISKYKYKFCQDTSTQTVRGTELYMSPILFKALHQKPTMDLQYNAYKSDVFSLGLCILLAGTLSYQVLYDIREINDMSVLTSIVKESLRDYYSEKFFNILVNMLQINEKDRVDFIELEALINTTYG